jgi:glycosyltransferase involved in cell wall biosynthesis
MTRKIVFVNRYFAPDHSATSQMLTDLAQALAEKGFDVHVICSRQLYDDSNARLPRDESIRGVHVRRLATTRFGRSRLFGRSIDYASFYAAGALRLLQLIRPGDILVAKTDPPLLSILAAPIAKLKRAFLVNWQQDVFPEIATQLGANPLPSGVDRWLRRLRDGSMRSARMNVAIGHAMRDYLAERDIPRSKLCVIENWSRDIRPKPSSASRLRKRLSLADRFVVCYSGNLGRAHEFDTLLAAARLLQHRPAFVFLIIGGGAKMSALQHAVSDSRLENFRFLPYQPREALEDSLAAADVHIVSLLPSLEGLVLPSKLYGILAAGRPLVFIGDTTGDIGRLIERGRCGRAICVGDSAALASALQQLLTEPQLCAEMGMHARKIFSDEFSLEHAVERWQRLIAEVDAPQRAESSIR